VKAFHFKVTVEVERESGKFMSRDEVEAELIDALEGADPGQVDGGPDGDTVMNVIEWTVASDD
jgi:hypothetical protein